MKIFNENMSHSEARKALFAAVPGKTEEEIREIKKEYSAVLDIIFARKEDLVANGWLTEDLVSTTHDSLKSRAFPPPKNT